MSGEVAVEFGDMAERLRNLWGVFGRFVRNSCAITLIIGAETIAMLHESIHKPPGFQLRLPVGNLVIYELCILLDRLRNIFIRQDLFCINTRTQRRVALRQTLLLRSNVITRSLFCSWERKIVIKKELGATSRVLFRESLVNARLVGIVVRGIVRGTKSGTGELLIGYL